MLQSLVDGSLLDAWRLPVLTILLAGAVVVAIASLHEPMARCLLGFTGVWLIINGFGYVVSSLTGLLFPDHLELVSRAVMPALFGEVAIVLWLVIVGARERAGAGAPQ